MSTQQYERSGWVTFAAIIMFAVAFARIISGIGYLDDSNDVNDLTNALFGDQLWVWGIWDLCVSALAFFAGVYLDVLVGHSRTGQRRRVTRLSSLVVRFPCENPRA